MVLVIEDLQWADRSTQDLLSFLVRNLRDERCSSSRRCEPMSPIPVATSSRSWPSSNATSASTGIDLARFDRDELLGCLQTSSVTSRMPGGRPDPGADRREPVLRRTGRRRVARDRRRRGAGAPPGCRARPGVRPCRTRARNSCASRLQPERGSTTSCSVGLSDLPAPEVRAALREVVDRRILVPRRWHGRPARGVPALPAPGGHPRRADPGERAHVHARYAAALEARAARSRRRPTGRSGPAPTAADLAYHWDAAGDASRALPAMVEAARAAESGYAYLEAHRRYLRSIELWDRVATTERRRSRSTRSRSSSVRRRPPSSPGSTTGGDRTRPPCHRTGRSAPVTRSGRPDSSSDSAGISGRRATGLPRRPRVEEANRLVPREPPSDARARNPRPPAGVHMFSGRFAESLPIAEEALDIARTIGSRVERGTWHSGSSGPISRSSDGSTMASTASARVSRSPRTSAARKGSRSGRRTSRSLLDQCRADRRGARRRGRRLGARAGHRRRTDIWRAPARRRGQGRDRSWALGRGGVVPRPWTGARPGGDARDPVADPARPARHDARRPLAGRRGPRRGRRSR